jgi:glycosyltransferase involved in cell wall biosynthesis
MKVGVVNVQCPFVWGGAEYLAESLVERVRGRGHQVELIRIPFQWYPEEQVTAHMLACRLMELGGDGMDLMIAHKFPAYLCPFPNKKLWLFHQFRQVYDLWGTPLGGLPDTPATRGLRAVVAAADADTLAQVKGIGGLFTNSKIVADRMRRFNGVDADEVLYPPLNFPDLFGRGEYGDYFFYPSRQGPMKRQHVVVEALRHTREKVHLVLAGKPDSDAYGKELNEKIDAWGLGDRVTQLGWVTEADKAKWMRGACGATYLPVDEDSYGFVTLEAFHSHKAVLTFTDSGGTSEVIEHGRNGLILEPTPEALAAGMDQLVSDKRRAREMGAEAFATLARHRIDWEYVLDRLVG